MRIKNLDLIVSLLIAVMNVGLILFSNRPLILGVILALPLVFFLPGYTLTEVMFSKRAPGTSDQLLHQQRSRAEQPFNNSDRFILSLGLSLAIAILAGFLLNLLSIGLQALSWVVFLGLVTAVFSLIAAFLRRGMLESANRRVLPRFRIAIHESVLFVLAIAIAVLSVFYSTVSAGSQVHPGFTQFWILPSTQANNSCAVLLGVQSFEAASVTYSVVITVNKSQVASWSSIVLSPQREWDQFVSVQPEVAKNMYVEALLYRTDMPGTVYRNVHLTLHSLRKNNSKDTQKCVSTAS